MQLYALTDFCTRIIDAHNQCRCGSVARVRSGLCLNCLLRDGLDDDQLSLDAFDAALAEIDVPDRDWQLGHHQILEEIGRGGMGVIYRARHLSSGRIVALKRVLTYHSDSQATLLRFQREAAAAASLDHPNILPIYDVGTTTDGLPYFTMKFATGGSLVNARSQYPNPAACAALIAKVARAVDYAHKQGVIHRDLKPGNILLDSRGEPMVADFGLAKWLDSNGDLTCTLTVFGTPGYIAPEQASGVRPAQNPAVDIYSVGAIFFELLSGRPPFLGEHAIGVIRQAAESPAPRLRSIAPKIHRDLEIICARCLDRDPEARYASAGELADDIERWLNHKPIIARKSSAVAKLTSWTRRNRPLAASICGCLVLGSAAVLWQMDNWRLGRKVRDQAVANHSVVILPFLDLDEATADSDLTHVVSQLLGSKLPQLGPSRVVNLSTPPAKWTGTGTLAEIQHVLKDTKCHAALVGVTRHIPNGIRISLRLAGPDLENSQSWALEIPLVENVEATLNAIDFGGGVYRALETSTGNADPRFDPVKLDPTAKAYFNAGRALLDRRTISDADRAIKCFENAVSAAPQSPSAHAYLALAYIGRNFLATDPSYIDRAYAAANRALRISPDDASAHRALCALDNFVGRLGEALEHGLRAIECGDPSERALGQIAFIWGALGRPDRAIQWFEKAKMSETQPADYEAILGDAWMLLTVDDKARDAYQASANFRPDLPEGWLGLCYLKLLHREYEDARRLFNEHVAEYSAFHTTKSFRAHLEFFARNYPEAERLYNEVLQADPRGVGVQQYGAISSKAALARVKMLNGDQIGAQKLLEQCLKEDGAELERSPRNPEVLYRLAADEAIRGNESAVLTYLRSSVAAGFIDYRSARMDPRFDSMAQSPEFQNILSMLAAHVAKLRERLEAIPQP